MTKTTAKNTASKKAIKTTSKLGKAKFNTTSAFSSTTPTSVQVKPAFKVNEELLSLFTSRSFEELSKDPNLLSLSISTNKNAIPFLRQHPELIDWQILCGYNSSEQLVAFLRENRRKIDWRFLTLNPVAIDLLHENKRKMYIPNYLKNPKALMGNIDVKRYKEKSHFKSLDGRCEFEEFHNNKARLDKTQHTQSILQLPISEIVKYHMNEIDWSYLTKMTNEKAVYLMTKNFDNLNRFEVEHVLSNPACNHIVEKLHKSYFEDMYYLTALAKNPNELVVARVFEYLDKYLVKDHKKNEIDESPFWCTLASNPTAIHKMKEHRYLFEGNESAKNGCLVGLLRNPELFIVDN